MSVISPEKMDLRSVVGLPKNKTLPVILLENSPLEKENVANGTKNAQSRRETRGKYVIGRSEKVVKATTTTVTKRRRRKRKNKFSFLENKPEIINPIAMLICTENTRLSRSFVMISEAWFWRTTTPVVTADVINKINEKRIRRLDKRIRTPPNIMDFK